MVLFLCWYTSCSADKNDIDVVLLGVWFESKCKKKQELCLCTGFASLKFSCTKQELELERARGSEGIE